MAMTRIYHNPRCSKSRDALKLLQDRGHEVEIVKYLETPPTAKDLKQLVKLLGVKPSELIRTGEKLFRELGLHEASLSASEWIEVLVENPRLIERPIVVHNGKAAIGRPLDNIQAILDAS